MTDFTSFGRLILLVGLAIAVVGLIIMAAGRVPFLGRLPGDVFIQHGNGSFYFPIVTCILISVIATIVLNLLPRR
jgi:hypothetical protein